MGAPGGPTESMDTPGIRLWAGVYPEIRYGDVIVNACSDQETSYLRNYGGSRGPTESMDTPGIRLWV